MNKNTQNIESLKIAQVIFEEDYEDFIEVVSNNQEEVSKVSTFPIDNYMNNVIDYIDEDLFQYIYQNIKYYLSNKMIYTPKMEEGIAIVVSKSVMLASKNVGTLRNYFSRGDVTPNHDLCNPFEEIARMILYAVKDENLISINSNLKASCDKLKLEDKIIKSVLNQAVSKNGIINKFKYHGNVDTYNNICADLELSSVDSNNARSATMMENKEMLQTQFNRIFDLYCTKVDYDKLITGYPSTATCDRLKKRFEDKMVYTKRNVGIYENTKRLVKKGQE